MVCADRCWRGGAGSDADDLGSAAAGPGPRGEVGAGGAGCSAGGIGCSAGGFVRLRSLKGEILVDELSGDEKVIQYPPDTINGLVALVLQ